MRRVLIFSVTYFPFVGGAEVAVKEIADRLRYQDVSFDLITLRFDRDLPEREKVGNITVHRVGFTKPRATTSDTYRFPLSFNKYLFPFLAYRKARELHAQHFFHILWSIQANYAGFAALFTKNALPHVPFLLTLQEGDPTEHYKKRVGVLMPLYKKIFTRADKVQAISTFLADFARSMGHIEPVKVVPNGADINHFAHTPSEKKIGVLLEKLSKKQKDVYLITVSRLVKKNAVDDCIRALSHLPEHVKLIVVGVGPDGAALWKLATNLGVEKRVLFTGHIPHEELPLYLHASDIFVRPSRSEGMGNVFIEAMAAGLPVIGTPVGGITDFLFDPDKTKLGKVTPTGLFCEVDSPKSIVSAIERLLKDTDVRDEIIHNASALAKEKYDWETIARTMWEEVLTPLLDRQGSRR